mmetsp:Transcript_12598/g.34241  ORF Transcript_12598/g.34241 Transcript_12598/m.34241 type:complete len:203 (+) Transcript_12598:60-668(+)
MYTHARAALFESFNRGVGQVAVAPDIQRGEMGALVGDGGDRGVGQVAAVPDIQRSEEGALVGDGSNRGVGEVAAVPDIQLSEVGALVGDGGDRGVGPFVAVSQVDAPQTWEPLHQPDNHIVSRRASAEALEGAHRVRQHLPQCAACCHRSRQVARSQERADAVDEDVSTVVMGEREQVHRAWLAGNRALGLTGGLQGAVMNQ